MLGKLMASTLMKAFAMAGTIAIALVVGTALAQTRTPMRPVEENVSETRINVPPVAATNDRVRVDPQPNDDVRIYTTESYNPDTGERKIETQVIAADAVAANPFAGPSAATYSSRNPSESDQRIGRLLRELRGRPGEPRDERKLAELREVVNLQFEERHAAQMQRLEKVMDDVRRTQEILERRARQRDEIVQRRVSELLGQPDPMQWDYQPGGLPRPATTQSLGNARTGSDDARGAEMLRAGKMGWPGVTRFDQNSVDAERVANQQLNWTPSGDAENIPANSRHPRRSSADVQAAPQRPAVRPMPPTPAQSPTRPAPPSAPLPPPGNPGASGAEPIGSTAIDRIPAELRQELRQTLDQKRRALEQAAKSMAEAAQSAAQSTVKAEDPVSYAKQFETQIREIALKHARQELAAAEEQFQLVEKLAQQMEQADAERQVAEVEREETNERDEDNQDQADEAIEIEEEQVQELK